MHLIIFDIDGTLVHPHQCEVTAFINALRQVTGIEEISEDLNTYEHVTDTGIAKECIQIHLGREPKQEELKHIEEQFITYFKHSLFRQQPQPVEGIHTLIAHLQKQPDIALAVGTGSFYRSALLKLRHAELPLLHVPIATCLDCHTRQGILQAAFHKATRAYQRAHFDSITYVGDGPWDVQAVKALDWDFLGLSTSYSKEALNALGANAVINNYHSHDQIYHHMSHKKRIA